MLEPLPPLSLLRQAQFIAETGRRDLAPWLDSIDTDLIYGVRETCYCIWSLNGNSVAYPNMVVWHEPVSGRINIVCHAHGEGGGCKRFPGWRTDQATSLYDALQQGIDHLIWLGDRPCPKTSIVRR